MLPGIANAIYDAIGLRCDTLPITPEKILGGLREMGGARPPARSKGRAA